MWRSLQNPRRRPKLASPMSPDSCACAANGHDAAPPSSVMKSRRFNRSNCIRPCPRADQECRISDWRGSVSGYCNVLQPISGPKVCFGQISEYVFTQRGSDSAVRASLPRVRTPQNRDISKPGLFQSSAGKLSPILPFPWYARGISLEQRKRNG